MRRSKQQPEPSSDAVSPAAATAAPPPTVTVAPTAADSGLGAPPLDVSDLERGRTTALLAAIGRIQLTLDLIERRLGRVEDRLEVIAEAQLAGPGEWSPSEAEDAEYADHEAGELDLDDDHAVDQAVELADDHDSDDEVVVVGVHTETNVVEVAEVADGTEE